VKPSVVAVLSYELILERLIDIAAGSVLCRKIMAVNDSRHWAGLGVPLYHCALFGIMGWRTIAPYVFVLAGPLERT
jgi:hypothetical protein